MSVLQSGITKSLAVDYDIDNSLRYNSADSPDLSRLPTSTGSSIKATLSVWVKFATPDTEIAIIGMWDDSGADDDDGYGVFKRLSTGELQFRGGTDIYLTTSALYRDTSAWYHIVLAIDSGNATADYKQRIYVNGSEVTDFSARNNLSNLQDLPMNTTAGNGDLLLIGADEDTSAKGLYFDGYMAELYWIDGLQYAASDFGELSSTTNQWIAIDSDDVSVTFGTNGCYQKYGGTELANSFTDSSGGFRLTEDVTADYFIVAGGGGGGSRGASAGGAAGGGAGGYRAFTSQSLSSGNYSIVVGSGGAAAPQDGSSKGSVGGDSSFNSYTSTGGGGGGNGNGPGSNGGDGGSGGGGSGAGNTGGSGNTPSTSPSQGNGGGNAQPTSGNNGGGGGGATGSGSNGSSNGGDGGAGTANTIRTGSSVTYAGGGGGGIYSGSNGSGGAGGGGDGGSNNGTDNTGGGAGGASGTGGANSGGVGGSGIVVIRYASASALAVGGTITSYVDGATTYQVHSFTSSAAPHTVTAEGDVANTRAVRKIGDSSIKFDGTTDWLESPDSSDWQLGDSGTGDFTWESWLYPTDTTSRQRWWTQYGDTNNRWAFELNTGGMNLYVKSGGVGVGTIAETSTSIVQDEWQHVAFVRDGSSTYFYVGGVSQALTTTVALGTMPDVSAPLYIGRYSSGSSEMFSGYMDEIRYSNSCRYPDGTTFTPSTTAFTADANTKLLIHSNWDGGLGADSSGNYNTFTATNLVATDQMPDTPTNNFCTINPLFKSANTPTYSEGNLKFYTGSGSEYQGILSTFPMVSGKWYWETYCIELSTNDFVGIISTDVLDDANNLMGFTGAISYFSETGIKRIDNVDSAYGAAYGNGDIVSTALNMDDSEVTFYKNGSTQGTFSLSGGITTASSVVAMNVFYGDDTGFYNFGQDSSFAGALTAQGNQDDNDKGDFYYDVPAGFLALCTDNLSDPEIKLPGENFNTVLWAGDDSAPRTITGVGFNPDLAWVKGRTAATDNHISDSIRGANNNLVTNSTGAEYNPATATSHGGIGAVTTDGFTLISGTADPDSVNESGQTYVAWNWKAGGAPTADNSAGVGAVPTAGSVKIDGSNLGSALAGTIAATKISANTTNGFSVVKYVGTGANATIAHGLSQAPELIIVKTLDSAEQWNVYAEPISSTPAEDYLELSTTNALNTNDTFWNDTVPSASVFTVGTYSGTNKLNDDYISYCFHSVEGYSKVGVYTGNGNVDGTFVYTGFRPAYVMQKNVTSTNGWFITDDARNTYNIVSQQLQADATSVEASEGTLDYVSNGFKLRTTSGGRNTSGDSYLYLAFAESPFKTSNAR